MPVADFGSLRGHGFGFRSGVEVGPSLSGWDVRDRLEATAIVEPVDPFQSGISGGLEAAPRAATMDDLSLEQTVDRLGKRVVIAVDEAAHRGFEERFGQALRVGDRQIL